MTAANQAQSGWRLRRHALLAVVAALLLGAGVFAGLFAYLNSAAFSDRMRRAVITTLERATGGRVEIGRFQWSLLHLHVQADDVTIHGLESAGQRPYFHADSIRINATVLSMLTPRIGLEQLQIQRPVLHLIVNPDGTTNQPQPIAGGTHEPIAQTLLHLSIQRTQIEDGVLYLNDRVVPWQLRANDVHVRLQYMGSQRYQAVLSVRDCSLQPKAAPTAHSSFSAQVEISPRSAELTQMEWDTPTTQLTLRGHLENYAHPVWHADVHGTVDLREVGTLTGYDPLRGGLAAVRLHAENHADGQLALDGNLSVQQGAFSAPWLQLQHVALRTHLHIDNKAISLTQFSSDLNGQGHVNGRLDLTHWRTEPPAAPVPSKRHWFSRKKPQPAPSKPHPLQAVMEATLDDLSTRLVMQAVTPRRFWDIGFVSRANGPVRATWHGPGDALDVHGDLLFTPERELHPGETPVHGTVHADYLGDSWRLVYQRVDFYTPGTEVHTSGTMTLLQKDPHSSMQGNVVFSNLREFDRLIYVVADTFPDSSLAVIRGPSFRNHSIVPVQLQDKGFFHGRFTGSMIDPVIDGHVDLQHFLLHSNGFGAWPSPVVQPAAPLAWDALHADVHLTYPEVDVHHLVATQGAARLAADLQILPTPLGHDYYAVDMRSGLRGQVQWSNASVDALAATLPTSRISGGTLSASAQVQGTMEDLYGVGNLRLQEVRIDGQLFASVQSPLNFSGRWMEAGALQLNTAGGSVQGDLAYNTLTHALRGGLRGQGLDLQKVAALQNGNTIVTGIADAQVQIRGFLNAPEIAGTAQSNNLAWNGQSFGQTSIEASLQHRTLQGRATAHAGASALAAEGSIILEPGLPAHLQLRCTNCNVTPALQSVTSLRNATVTASGTLRVDGPLRQLRLVQAAAELSQVSIATHAMTLAAMQPVHLSLQEGVVQLQSAHLQGMDSDATVSGSAGLLDGQRLSARADGHINAAIADTFAAGLNATGEVRFSVRAYGTVPHPLFTGSVQVVNLNAHLTNLTNGLSAANGTLAFDQDRLVIQHLSGYTGGGKIDLTGFASLHNGLALDVTANAQNARIRYPKGITSTANVHLHLNGSPDALLLRGNIMLTRFAASQDVDLAALAATAQSMNAPIDPSSWLNRVHLDIHLTSTPELGFQNSFASLAGDIDLHIRGTLANPSVLGRIDITQGKATFAGTQYDLQRGDIVFANPVTIEPELNLQATARVRDYDIIISLTGSANKMQINYRSEPPLSQSDVLALLTLGRTNEEAALYGEQQQAGADTTEESLLGGALNTAVSGSVSRLFGAASVRVDPNFVGVLGQSTARVTVEQQVGRKITLVFATNVNTTAQQLLQAEYDFTRNFSIIAVRDEADVFSLYFQIRGKHH